MSNKQEVLPPSRLPIPPGTINPAALINDIMCYTVSDRTKLRHRPPGGPLVPKSVAPRRIPRMPFDVEESAAREHIHTIENKERIALSLELLKQTMNVLARLGVGHEEALSRKTVEEERSRWLQRHVMGALPFTNPPPFEDSSRQSVKDQESEARRVNISLVWLSIQIEEIVIRQEPAARRALTTVDQPMTLQETLGRAQLIADEVKERKAIREEMRVDAHAQEKNRVQRRSVEDEELTVRDQLLFATEEAAWRQIIKDTLPLLRGDLALWRCEVVEERSARELIETEEAFIRTITPLIWQQGSLKASETASRCKIVLEEQGRRDRIAVMHYRRFAYVTDAAIADTNLWPHGEYRQRRFIIAEQKKEENAMNAELAAGISSIRARDEERSYFLEVTYFSSARRVFLNKCEDERQKMMEEFVEIRNLIPQRVIIRDEECCRAEISHFQETFFAFTVLRQHFLWRTWHEGCLAIGCDEGNARRVLSDKFELKLRAWRKRCGALDAVATEESIARHDLAEYENTVFGNILHHARRERSDINRGIMQKKKAEIAAFSMKETEARYQVEASYEVPWFLLDLEETVHRKSMMQNEQGSWRQCCRNVVGLIEGAARDRIVIEWATDPSIAMPHTYIQESLRRRFLEWAWENNWIEIWNLRQNERPRLRKALTPDEFLVHDPVDPVSRKDKTRNEPPPSCGSLNFGKEKRPTSAEGSGLTSMFLDWITLKEVVGRGKIMSEESVGRKSIAMLCAFAPGLERLQKFEKEEENARKAAEDAILWSLERLTPKRYYSALVRQRLLQVFEVFVTEEFLRSILTVQERDYRAKIIADRFKHSGIARARDLGRRLGALGPLEESSRRSIMDDELMTREIISLRLQNFPQKKEELGSFQPHSRKYGAPVHVDAALMVQAAWKLHELRRCKRTKAWRLQHDVTAFY